MTAPPESTPAGLPPAGRCDGIAGDAEAGTGPQITAEDVAGAVAAKDAAWQAGRRLGELDVITAVLASTLRPGGLVARAVAAELERLAGAVEACRCCGAPSICGAACQSSEEDDLLSRSAPAWAIWIRNYAAMPAALADVRRDGKP